MFLASERFGEASKHGIALEDVDQFIDDLKNMTKSKL